MSDLVADLLVGVHVISGIRFILGNKWMISLCFKTLLKQFTKGRIVSIRDQ